MIMKQQFQFIWQLTILCLLQFTATYTYAFSDSYNAKIYGITEGISHLSINAIHKNKDGLILAGTAFGLNIIYRNKIVHFYHDPIDNNSLPSNHINSIIEDDDGNYWIGTEKGVCKFNYQLRKFVNYYDSFKQRSGLKYGGVMRVKKDSQGKIWVLASDFAALYIPSKNDFRIINFDVGQYGNATRNYFVYDMHLDSKDRYWFTTSYGVKQLNLKNEKIKSYHFKEFDSRLVINATTVIAEDKKNTLYVGTWGGGLLQFNEVAQQFQPVKFNFVSNDKQAIFSISTNSQLLVTTANNIYKGAVNAVSLLSLQDKVSQLVQGAAFQCIEVSDTNQIWLGTNKGLIYIEKNNAIVSFTTGIRFNDNLIEPTAVLPNPYKKDNILISTNDIFSVNNASHEQLGFAIQFEKQSPAVWGMHAGKKYIWIATATGLFAIRDNKIFTSQDVLQKRFSFSKLWKVFEDSKGNLWVSTIRKGVYRIELNTGRIDSFFTNTNDINTLYNHYTTHFLEDSKHNIWFVANNTIYKYSYATKSFIVEHFDALVDLKPQIFGEDENGNLLIISKKGLYHLSQHGAKRLALTHANIAIARAENALYEGNGKVWLQHRYGIVLFDMQTGAMTDFGNRFIPEGVSIHTFYKEKNTLFLGIDGGCVVVDIKKIFAEQAAFTLAFSKINLNGTDTVLPSSETVPFKYQSSITLSVDEVYYKNGADAGFMYRLLGTKDTLWQKGNTDGDIHFAQLSDGVYSFQAYPIINGNRAGTMLELHFTVMKPFWRSWWFLLSTIALIIAITALIVQTKLTAKLRIEQMRNNIADDLHDEIGSGLSGIAMYGETLQQRVQHLGATETKILTKITALSKELVTGMSDIVWAIQPDNDKGDKAAQRIENTVLDARQFSKAQLSCTIDYEFKQTHLPIHIRKNLFLIFKEAFNNALKYSDAENIEVRIHCIQAAMVLEINDDGKGFEINLEYKGNGLKNMQKRANEIDGSYIMESFPGLGTKIKLQVPIA
jgi:signal transduction histidine kinase/ligand-binding sensor domain-containing protein